MAKYLKKPVAREAQQWFPGVYMPHVYPGLDGEYGPFVVTAHGQRAFLTPGDWVVAEPDGRGHYLRKPDIFEAEYERAD